MHPKIVVNHSTPFRLPGVRDLLERIAALDGVERVIPGRTAPIGSSGRLRLADSGMAAGRSGRKYTILVQGTALELFIVPAAGRLADVEAQVCALPEYVLQGSARRAVEAEAAAARAARLAEARRHHGPRRQR